jgi:Flp pilus assembly protein TadG
MQSNQNSRCGRGRRKQRGVEMIEFTLVLLPFLGFMFLILNIAYAVYTRATVQHAVAEGVRYAVTSATMTGMGARASIQEFVQQNASARLGATAGNPPSTNSNGWNGIYVDWYIVNPDGTTTSKDGVAGGNCMQTDGTLPLVEVSVQNLPGTLFLPFVKSPSMTSMNAIGMGAVAWDRMEAPPLDPTSSTGYSCPAQ